MNIALFFMYHTFGGGTTSFTVHLYESLRRAGYAPSIYRVKERSESNQRPFSKYHGVGYRNITSDEALCIAKSIPSLMTAPCNSKYLTFDPDIIGKLIKAGMRVVVHDPSEIEIYKDLNVKPHTPICIRPTMQQFFPDSIWIPHPYVPEYDKPPTDQRPLMAVSVARVTFVKRTELILEANRLLPKENQIILRGAENRLYTKFKILPKFPEYKQGHTGYPMTWGASARECAVAKYAVDLTWFPDDGGGTQYSFMEAWDAGAVNILHADWLRYKGEMKEGKNCLAIGSPEDLAYCLQNGRECDVTSIVEEGRKQLKKHDPVKIGKAYYEEVTR